jgi:hypothetical protein
VRLIRPKEGEKLVGLEQVDEPEELEEISDDAQDSSQNAEQAVNAESDVDTDETSSE